MKWLVALVLVGATTAAAAPDVYKPSPAKRKPALEKYSVESLIMFVDAVIADKAGDLHTADSKYGQIADDGHPSTLYNLADVKRRLENDSQAIRYYQKYLEAAPDAPDRKEVERLIETIKNRPFVAVIDGEDMDAVVLVDGKLIGPSPAHVSPKPGPHVADRIGPRTYRHEIISGRSSGTEHVRMNYTEAEGNVVLVGSWQLRLAGTWEDNGTKYVLPGRFTLAPGHYETYVKSSQYACNKIAFDVGKGDDITYVYVDVMPGDSGKFCKDVITKVQKIRLPK